MGQQSADVVEMVLDPGLSSFVTPFRLK